MYAFCNKKVMDNIHSEGVLNKKNTSASGAEVCSHDPCMMHSTTISITDWHPSRCLA